MGFFYLGKTRSRTRSVPSPQQQSSHADGLTALFLVCTCSFNDKFITMMQLD